MSFKFLNIPVFIRPTFWLLLLIFSFDPHRTPLQMLLLAFVLSFSLLFHEYGHALAARKFGRDPEITLEDFGGYAAYDGRGLSENQHCIITLCGPLFTGLLIVIPYYLLANYISPFPVLNDFLYYTMRLNIYWLIVNLAPLSPLDGGKIAEYLLKKWLGVEKGYRFSLILGNITALVGGLYFLFFANYLFAYLFLFHGWRNFQIYKSTSSKQKPSAFSLYNQALEALDNKENEKAKSLLIKLSKSKDDYFKVRSVERLADLLERSGSSKEAYKMLSKIDPTKLNAGKWLLCKLAYSQGNYSLAETFSREIYDLRPTFETALLNAKTYAQLKNPTYSLGWLKTALQFEEAQTLSLSDLLADPAFALLRDHPETQKIK
jgi:Zn-dependent protease